MVRLSYVQMADRLTVHRIELCMSHTHSGRCSHICCSRALGGHHVGRELELGAFRRVHHIILFRHRHRNLIGTGRCVVIRDAKYIWRADLDTIYLVKLWPFCHRIKGNCR